MGWGQEKGVLVCLDFFFSGFSLWIFSFFLGWVGLGSWVSGTKQARRGAAFDGRHGCYQVVTYT